MIPLEHSQIPLMDPSEHSPKTMERSDWSQITAVIPISASPIGSYPLSAAPITSVRIVIGRTLLMATRTVKPRELLTAMPTALHAMLTLVPRSAVHLDAVPYWIGADQIHDFVAALRNS